jgi:hypothetical protein
MKQYDFFKAVATEMTGDVHEYAQAWLDKYMLAKDEKVKLHDKLDEQVFAILEQATAPVTAKEITDSMSEIDITQGKVVAACGRLVRSGRVTRIEGKPSTYKVAEDEAVATCSGIVE